MSEFKLPAIGEGVVEGEIVRWLKQPGDAFHANEAVVEVMTDKATVEIPAEAAGVMVKHLAAEGDICAVGQALAWTESAGAVPSAASPAAQEAGPTSVEAPVPVGPAAPAGIPLAAAASNPSPATPAASGPAVPATPAARAMARERGIDLAQVPAREGRITRHEVEAFVAPVQVAAPPAASRAGAAATVGAATAGASAGAGASKTAGAPAGAGPATTVGVSAGAGASAGDGLAEAEYLPFRGMRRRIAEMMSKSYSTAVHYTYVEEIDMTRLVELRSDARKAAEQEGVKLTYLPFIVKAVVHGLRRFPIVNAELDEANGRVVLKKRYHVGIATATEQGLMVPVVRDADRRSILEVAREIERVSDAARKGTASREELTGSTFTITSLGTIGGLLATPILNYPEVGILGVHAIRKRPVVTKDDRIVIGHVMNLSVSLDHRIVDGFEGASFLQEVRRYLEDPTLLLLAGI